jgi:hypothetical protein
MGCLYVVACMLVLTICRILYGWGADAGWSKLLRSETSEAQHGDMARHHPPKSRLAALMLHGTLVLRRPALWRAWRMGRTRALATCRTCRCFTATSTRSSGEPGCCLANRGAVRDTCTE